MAQPEFPYPRRRLLRWVLQHLSRLAFALLTDFRVFGRENLPQKGPLLVVGNHFSFSDPVAFVRVLPWPIEFIGGFEMPNAPDAVKFIPKLWGYYPVFRGAYSRYALRAAEAVLAQDGVVGVFPEAGNWATVLRPARPGAAFLAAQTGAPILPIGLAGLEDIFPLRPGRRAPVTVRIGRPFGPFRVQGRGRARRHQLEKVGHRIMEHIAELIPPEKRGHYSDDPAVRAAAQGTEVYPWDESPEGM
ncbi:MAG: 1-acyl-sn-glycerol-3-phosphate acyltransferase [Anaerolineae bacterium]|nr:1-acyl-sn-glycerol-3-phosphate acyltransferase [Anaerolineae bacterium]